MRPPALSFDEFVRSNAADLVRTAYLISWDELEAEDLVQECLFVVAKRWPRVVAMEMPLAYARRVLVNLALDGRAKRVRRNEFIAGTEIVARLRDARAEAALDMTGVRADLIDALGRLPRQQRTVLGLRYFMDLSEAQAAAVLGCSVGTVKSNASRGLAKLRELVGPDGAQSEVKSYERHT